VLHQESWALARERGGPPLAYGEIKNLLLSIAAHPIEPCPAAQARVRGAPTAGDARCLRGLRFE
jgi:hypothetical protein